MKKPGTSTISGSQISALEAWDNVDLFPEKTAKAKAILAKAPLPPLDIRKKRSSV